MKLALMSPLLSVTRLVSRLPRRGEDWVGLAVALSFTLLLVLGCAAASWQATDRQLIYALDDPYIHLAMARTFAQDAIWGINAATPGAASSAPLWTLLLAAWFKLGGVQIWLPLVGNVVAVLLIVVVAEQVLRDWFAVPVLLRTMLLAAIVVVGPLAPLVMTGLEHTPHSAAVLVLAWYALEPRPISAALLGGWAALATGLRYETVFVAVGLGLVKLARRQFKEAVALLAGCLATICAVGCWQLSMGQGFLPNSLFVKGLYRCGLGAWLAWRLHVMAAAPRELLLLVTLCALGLVVGLAQSQGPLAGPSFCPTAADFSAAFLVAALLHLAFAKTGWFYRYEAYLVVWGAVAAVGVLYPFAAHAYRQLAASARGAWGKGAAVVGGAALATALGLALGGRAAALGRVPTAARNIYEQQYQMARFVRAYYDHSPIVLNDIGYVGFLSAAPILDIWGLASREVARAIIAGRWQAAAVAEAARRHGAVVAICYPSPLIPSSWQPVAAWRIRNRVACAADTVCFYALTAAQRRRLLFNLRRFQPQLPATVEVEYFPAAGGPLALVGDQP
jgi:hypothetical protein